MEKELANREREEQTWKVLYACGYESSVDAFILSNIQYRLFITKL